MVEERLYIVTYDIAEPRRWRRVFKLMNGYGEWLQLSVFQCRLRRKRKIELQAALSELINHDADHVLLLDLGNADKVELRVNSLGKVFAAVTTADHHLRRSLMRILRRRRASAAVARKTWGALASMQGIERLLILDIVNRTNADRLGTSDQRSQQRSQMIAPVLPVHRLTGRPSSEAVMPRPH